MPGTGTNTGRIIATLALAALAACAGVPGKEKDLAAAHYRMGEAQFQKGRGLEEELNRRQAYPDFLKAVKLDPGEPRYHIGLGTIYFYDGKIDDAEAEFREALRLDPENADAHNSLGSVRSRKGDFEEAVKEYDRALENRSYMRPHVAYFNRGQAYYQLKEYDRAVESYTAALGIVPQAGPVWYNLGLALEKLKKSAEAEKAFRRAVEINPDLAPPHYYLGLNLSAQKRNEEAAAEFRRVLELDPTGEMGKNAAKYLSILK